MSDGAGPARLSFTRAGPIAAMAVLVAHLASFDIARYPIVSDVRFYLYFAWRISEGAVPHRDYFDHKTQLASFVGALFHQLGAWLGCDSLLAIRAGFLALAGASGWLAFTVQRRLGAGEPVAGWCGALAHCSFGLLAFLPAVGCVPKLITCLCAPAAALLAQRGRWLCAGWVGATALLDWQVGALAWLAVLVSALLFARPRAHAVARVALGGALGVLPFFVYFAGHGALGLALRQTFGGSLQRAAGTLARDTFARRLARIHALVEADCPGAVWLFYLSLAGAVVAAVWLWRRPGMRPLLAPLCLYHAGVIAFALVDFQLHADLFMLLHTVAFLQGLVWTAIFTRLRHGFPGLDRRLLAALVLALAVLAARPSFLRPELRIETSQIGPRATLADQREVAARLTRRLRDRTLLCLESIELLYLMPRVNPLPVVYWNEASWPAFRENGESMDATMTRLLESVAPDALALPRLLPELERAYRFERIRSQNGQYSVLLYVR